MEKYCNICKEDLNVPHWLPCNHHFCYICIRRHLLNRNFCPQCLSYPLGISDLKTNEIIHSDIKKPIYLFKSTQSTLKKELKRFRVSTEGNVDRLKWRYNELCIQIDNDRFKEKPRSTDTIVRHLHLRESLIFTRSNTLEMSKVIVCLIKLKIEMNSQLGKDNDKRKRYEINECEKGQKPTSNTVNLLKFITKDN